MPSTSKPAFYKKSTEREGRRVVWVLPLRWVPAPDSRMRLTGLREICGPRCLAPLLGIFLLFGTFSTTELEHTRASRVAYRT